MLPMCTRGHMQDSYTSGPKGSGTINCKASTLQELLYKRSVNTPDRGLILYEVKNTLQPSCITYRELYDQARKKSSILRSLEGFHVNLPVLLQLDTHWRNILWFWTVLFADGVPVIASPLSNVAEQRHKNIRALCTLLESPICITTSELIKSFDCDHGFRLHTIDALAEERRGPETHAASHERESTTSETAMLMLTSGSTGNAKAVVLKHRQVLASVAGKDIVRDLPYDKPFLNWIGLDHVAGLTEIHLHAMYHGVDQIHIHADEVLCTPRLFLDLLSRHHVSRSFAPNFFLAKLASQSKLYESETWDFQNLKFLVSGGEANDVGTVLSVSSLLMRYGAPADVVASGFGMTETCAGAIYNTNCPSHDVQYGLAITSLGKCMAGIEMRISHVESELDAVTKAVLNQIGDLEVRGEVVFEGYYRNHRATINAFTSDGWFCTGDRAVIDNSGHLNLVGRTNDFMNINGIKISPGELQSFLEQALGTLINRVTCFPVRRNKSHTEQITVIYVPKDALVSAAELQRLDGLILQTCLLSVGAAPFIFSLVDQSLLPQTSLGKISRAKLRSMFEGGVFSHAVALHHDQIRITDTSAIGPPSTKSEMSLMEDVSATLCVEKDIVDVEKTIFDMGITSIDLIRLKRRIDDRLFLDIPIITLMRNPTVRSMAVAIEGLQAGGTYTPIVTFRSSGSKIPLWLVHPGVGEVLVFLGLSHSIKDRPVYALRARGFDGEPPFANIAEAVEVYRSAIKSQQPEGPYAIAGYSYGAMLAFETAKLLERDGDEVRFLGSFNLPPHIKSRMRQSSWNSCLLHLAQFLYLLSEDHVNLLMAEFKHVKRTDALIQLMEAASKSRIAELGLNMEKMVIWTDVACNLQGMAANYEPAGFVRVIDVFHAIPLRAAAKSRADWVDNHLSKWMDFCRTQPVYHKVEGAHYTMIGPEHVASFSQVLETALEARGL